MGRIEDQLIRHEGLRLSPYIDTAGKITIGVGHNLTDNPISKIVAMRILKTDINIARADVDFLLDHYAVRKWTLNEARIDALINMAFNLGRKNLSGFKRMFGFIAIGDFVRASKAMLESKWAIQVGARAKELAEQMETGVYKS